MTMGHKYNLHPKGESLSRRHIEVIEEEGITSTDWIEEDPSSRGSRKSPAAEFGSRRIGAVVLPDQLQESVTRLIESVSISSSLLIFELKTILGSDKSMLHVDAKRIFGTADETNDSKWDSQYDVKYKSYKQAYHHSQRDGTAFASVALPAHFSAIYSVLAHVKQRLGSEWKVERVIDWGAGTGSGLWLVIFFHSHPTTDPESQGIGVQLPELSGDRYGEAIPRRLEDPELFGD